MRVLLHHSKIYSERLQLNCHCRLLTPSSCKDQDRNLWYPITLDGHQTCISQNIPPEWPYICGPEIPPRKNSFNTPSEPVCNHFHSLYHHSAANPCLYLHPQCLMEVPSHKVGTPAMNMEFIDSLKEVNPWASKGFLQKEEKWLFF